MKKLIFIATMLATMVPAVSAQAIQRDDKVEAQVEQLLSRMTLDDKVGQMCELCIDCIAQKSSDNNVKDNSSAQTLANGRLSVPAMERVFGQYKVGSILNVPEGLALIPQEWCDVIRTVNQQSAKYCNGVPQLYGLDMIHGASYVWGATLFPQEIGQAASFNAQIPFRIGQITAYETRAAMCPWVYSPTMDLSRSQQWPRMWESFGEDVLVNGVMASQLTRGLQGDDPNHLGLYNVAACLKHYMAYGAAASGKDRTPSSVSDREMMEKYFVPFRMCIEAGALSIMVNSSNNNGVNFHTSHKFLTKWLKEGLNWDGMIVTDWADIDNIWKRDRVAANKKDAICMAINAGIDMSMEPYSTEFTTMLKELVNEGRVPMSRIDDAVRRILRLKIRVGLMDSKTWDYPYTAKGKKAQSMQKMYADFGSDKFAAEATDMAAECMVLLKNEGNLLPLAGKKLLVCGPNADSYRTMNGGWTYTWQGWESDSVCRKIGKYHTFLDALRNRFGAENVTYEPLLQYDSKDDWQSVRSVGTLGNVDADVIIAFVGENSYTETPGNVDDLTLCRKQIDMVKQLAATGKPVVLVLNEGRPRLITEIEPLAKAIVHTFLPSNYGGNALAQLLAGDTNFSGRLPFTYPKHINSFATYDYKPCEKVATMEGAYNYDAKMDILYPFGYGLSYSDVKVSNLRVGQLPAATSVDPITGAKFADDARIEFTVELTNNSDREVKEPVLLFISDMVARITPDVRRLRAFDKVTLKPHETKTVTLAVKPADLSYVDEDLNHVLEPGDFRAAIGTESLVFTLPAK